MQLQFTTLDVFTSKIYSGNPLAVIHVPAHLRDVITQEQKQDIAREFNLSESVFLHARTEEEKQKGDVKIDIFTVSAEVPFAGHPTIGTSNYLLRYLQNDAEWTGAKALLAKAGRMPIELVSSLPGSQGEEGVKLAVAHNVHLHKNRLGNAGVLEKFPSEAHQGFVIGNYPIFSSVKGMTFILINLDNLDDLRLKPTQNLIGGSNTYTSQHLLDGDWQVGILTSYFFVDLGTDKDGVRLLRTRMMGSREDPATGSAASALCAYLSLTEEGTQVRRFKLTQGVEMGRKSDIGVEVTLKSNKTKIEHLVLSGTAIKVMEGVIEVPGQ